MPPSPGDRLGPYEILSVLGAGGMGEVYRAHDPRMGRDVAIKLSREQFTERFDREVRAVAALNHPNICTIFDVGPNYYVMELVDGPTLDDRIRQGPIPWGEALEISRQVADALEAAHEKGIIHRDLKPANIKLKPDGTVKVLDFGLAKLGAGTDSGVTAGGDSRTMTMGATQAGAILGTAAYMSPEQARGKTVDRRTDTWAFGVVLFEMLTGQQAFPGETITDIIAAVVQRHPDLTGVPNNARTLLARCLEKDPKRRLREASDGLLLLENAPAAPAAAAPQASRFARRAGVASLVFLLAFTIVAFLHFREKASPAETVRFQFALPPNVTFTRSGLFAISPDGRKIAFSAFGAEGVPRIFIRDLASLAVQPIPNLETSTNLYTLFWSPDSRFLVVNSDEKLKRVNVADGTAQVICDAPGSLFGGSWNRDDVILYASAAEGSIMRVAASGGTPVRIVTRRKDENFIPIYPVFLPDGRHFLYSRAGGKDRRAISAGSLEAKPEAQSDTLIVQTDYSFSYLADSGRLLFLNGGTLFAQQFDQGKLTVTGDPVTLADHVAVDDSPALGYISGSATGSLVYLPAAIPNLQLTWFSRQGEPEGKAPGGSGEFSGMRVSPDGSKAVVRQIKVFAGQSSLWVMDFTRGVNNRFTFGGAESGAVWSPDSQRIAWRSSSGGNTSIVQKPASGAGTEEAIYQVGGNIDLNPTDWSRDGRYLIFTKEKNIWALPLAPSGNNASAPIPLVQSPDNKSAAVLSPDNRWVAYLSSESGKPEVYVQGVNLSSSNGGKWMVSRGASGLCGWRADGKELLYFSADGGLMAVDLPGGAVFQPGPPQLLFKLPPQALRLASNPSYFAGATADHKRILLSMPLRENERQELSVILNWHPAQAK